MSESVPDVYSIVNKDPLLKNTAKQATKKKIFQNLPEESKNNYHFITDDSKLNPKNPKIGTAQVSKNENVVASGTDTDFQ